METELQNKVKSLNEHQCKVDKMEEELIEIAKKQKYMLNLEVKIKYCFLQNWIQIYKSEFYNFRNNL